MNSENSENTEIATTQDNSGSKLSGAEKSAILLMSLGEDEAAKVLQHMGPKEVKKIGMAMAEVSNIRRETVIDVLDYFLDN